MTIKDLRKHKAVKFDELNENDTFEKEENIFIKLSRDCGDDDHNAYCLSDGYLVEFYEDAMVKPVHVTILIENNDEDIEEEE